ncbi:MAG: HD domain-containing protein [Candidatus Omnitrophica bacterium]|nr:HD domain-containing protein [Candidatus Omnitrophota bacterium]
MVTKVNPSVVERFMLPNPSWQEGYHSFNHLFGRPLGWLFIATDAGTPRMLRLDRKGNCSFYSANTSNEQSCDAFLTKYSQLMQENEDTLQKLPTFYRCAFGKNGAVFALRHLGKVRGLLILCALTRPEKDICDLLIPFDHFLQSHVELAYKTFELNNFYETVHPRALALSTMHSVHRVISSSLRLSELLPRIGRLSAQVLKAKGCSIMLCDAPREYLLPYFSFGENKKYIHQNRLRIGRGLEGRIAKTGEFYLSRRAIGVPFIEDDVVGLIILWDKIDHQPFTQPDLEILKSLSEQAVVAIKNAQLYEETEQLTLGSIKTINELLEMNFGGSREELPVMGEMILEVGKALELSSRELTQLERAIVLLDTGTLVLPEKVWRKKGKLTKKEFDQVRKIPMQGAVLLRSISSLKPIIPIILHHRERFDGKGYPEGLAEDQIPIGARIVSVVDSFLAMISRRSYREPLGIDQALHEIEINSGTQFDPKVVEAFLKVVRRKEIFDKIKKLHLENLALSPGLLEASPKKGKK